MKDTILIGKGENLLEVPAEVWRKHLASSQHHTAAMLSFMTGDHHLVRNFVVRELPRNHGKPLSPEDISQGIYLPLSRVTTILADLHKNLFFLVRTNTGEVSWAFPVTSDRTPHRLYFSSGEQTFAA